MCGSELTTPPPLQHVFSAFMSLLPSLPVLSLFITYTLAWHFTVFFSSQSLSNFPTDRLPVPSSVFFPPPSLCFYMRRYAWITSILSPWPQYSLSTARISICVSVCVCAHALFMSCGPFSLAPLLCVPLSPLIMSVDQFITCADLYRHRLWVWRHWIEKESIVIHQWLNIYCICKSGGQRWWNWTAAFIDQRQCGHWPILWASAVWAPVIRVRKCLCSSIRYALLISATLNPLIQRVIIIIVISCIFEILKCYNEWSRGLSLKCLSRGRL